MKHRTSGRKFGRNRQGRRALFVGLTRSLIQHGHITTTEERAKTLRTFVEKLFTTARRGTLAARRLIQKTLQNPDNAKKLLGIAATAPSSGGFTQMTKVFIRKGDAARMAEIRLISPVVPEKTPVLGAKQTKGTKPS